MWQNNQAENDKLRVHLRDMRQELEYSKRRLENFTEEVSQTSVLVDTRKQEKEEVVDRLTKMEKELKVKIFQSIELQTD